MMSFEAESATVAPSWPGAKKKCFALSGPEAVEAPAAPRPSARAVAVRSAASAVAIRCEAIRVPPGIHVEEEPGVEEEPASTVPGPREVETTSCGDIMEARMAAIDDGIGRHLAHLGLTGYEASAYVALT